MLNGSMNKGTVSYRSGTSFARGLTIDLVLSPEDTKALYAKWNNAWGEPLQCGGGEIAITCEMVAQVPLNVLVKAYGKNVAARLLQIAQKNAQV